MTVWTGFRNREMEGDTVYGTALNIHGVILRSSVVNCHKGIGRNEGGLNIFHAHVSGVFQQDAEFHIFTGGNNIIFHGDISIRNCYIRLFMVSGNICDIKCGFIAQRSCGCGIGIVKSIFQSAGSRVVFNSDCGIVSMTL